MESQVQENRFFLSFSYKSVSMYTYRLIGGVKVPKEGCPFGDYLKGLIKANGMTQSEFYTALGIKKPYFYDIVSGRVNPPPYSLQFKAMEILNADEQTRELFFDMAAQGRKELPADIAQIVTDNPVVLANIRKNIKLLTQGR